MFCSTIQQETSERLFSHLTLTDDEECVSSGALTNDVVTITVVSLKSKEREGEQNRTKRSHEFRNVFRLMCSVHNNSPLPEHLLLYSALLQRESWRRAHWQHNSVHSITSTNFKHCQNFDFGLKCWILFDAKLCYLLKNSM